MASVFVDSLKLNGDDAEDLIRELELAFGTSFGRKLDWTKAGDVLRAVEEQLPSSAAPSWCASSMTFYRLRRAVRDELDLSPSPNTPLYDVLGPKPSTIAKKLAAASGLRINGPGLTWRGGLGCLTLLAAFLPLFSGLGEPGMWMVLAGMVGLGAVLLKTDPGRYAARTFGDWARSVSHQNAGLLMRLGGDSRPKSVWASVASILETHSGVPSEQIGYETALWPQEKKRAA